MANIAGQSCTTFSVFFKNLGIVDFKEAWDYQESLLNLLKVKPKLSAITKDERFIQSFLEINEFYSTHDRAPEESTDIKERQLWMRLNHIKNDYEKCF